MRTFVILCFSLVFVYQQIAMEGGRGRARGRATAKPVSQTITPGPSRGLQPAPVLKHV